MSTAYAGVNVFPTTIPIPSDGDMKTAAAVGAALQGLKDATTYLALIHLGTNPAGVLKNPTIKGNVTYTKDGSNRSHNMVDIALTIDDLSAITINGPASTAPAVSISRNVSWPEGNHSYGGVSGQTVTYACPTFYSQPISLSGIGRIRHRRVLASASSGDRSISINACDVFLVRAGDIAGGDKGVLQNGTADAGNNSWDQIRLVSSDATPLPLYAADGVTALQDANGSVLVLVASASPAPGEYASVLLQWTGAYWEWIGQ